MRQWSLLFCFAGLSASAFADFTTIDLSAHFNERRRITFGAASFPQGSQTYGSIPFRFGQWETNDFWNSNHVGLPGNVVLDVALNQERATKVHTVLNALWGTSDSGLLSLEFFGQGGSYHREDWTGFNQFRSMSNGIHLNTTSSPNTHQVWSHALTSNDIFWHDRQEIALPSTFLTDTLTGFRITDRGFSGYQRVGLMALTVESAPPPPPPVPEPISLIALGTALCALLRRR